MTLIYQEAQFVRYLLMDFEPVKTSHGWRNMIIFSEITDDSTAHVLNTLAFIFLILSRSCQERITVVHVGPGL